MLRGKKCFWMGSWCPIFVNLRSCNRFAFSKNLAVFIVIYFGIALKLQTKYKRTATTKCSCNWDWFFFYKIAFILANSWYSPYKMSSLLLQSPYKWSSIRWDFQEVSVFGICTEQLSSKELGVSTGKSILAKRSNFKPVFYVINDIIHSQTPNFDPNPR